MPERNERADHLEKDAIDNEVVNEKLTAEQREKLVDLILFCYYEWKKQ